VLGPLGEAGRIETGAVKARLRAGPVTALPAFRMAGRVIAVPAVGFADPAVPDFAATTRCVVPLPVAKLTSGPQA
jgi:hypothetical protein